MKEHYYFTLFIGHLVANTYVGTRSNARAYFKRWIEKEIPNPEDYSFAISRYSYLSDMLLDLNPLSCTEFTV